MVNSKKKIIVLLFYIAMDDPTINLIWQLTLLTYTDINMHKCLQSERPDSTVG